MTIARACLIVLPLVSAAWPDTISLRNNQSYNGKLVSIDKATVTFRWRGKDGKDADAPIPRAEVVSIEFNTKTVNQGPPPELGAHEGNSAPAPVPSVFADRLVFRGSGQNKTCPGVLIDGGSVKCGNKSFTRDEVWRVFLTQP